MVTIRKEMFEYRNWVTEICQVNVNVNEVQQWSACGVGIRESLCVSSNLSIKAFNVSSVINPTKQAMSLEKIDMFLF